MLHRSSLSYGLAIDNPQHSTDRKSCHTGLPKGHHRSRYTISVQLDGMSSQDGRDDKPKMLCLLPSDVRDINTIVGSTLVEREGPGVDSRHGPVARCLAQ